MMHHSLRRFTHDLFRAHTRLAAALALWLACLFLLPLNGQPAAAYMAEGKAGSVKQPAKDVTEPDITWGLDADTPLVSDAPPKTLERTPEQLQHEERLLRMFAKKFGEGFEGWKENRKNAAHDDKFVLGLNQWNTVAAALRAGRPMPVVNKTHISHFQIVNDFAQNMPAPDIGPDDDQAHADVARVLMGLWRYTNKRSKANAHRLLAFAQAVMGGYGYWEIALDWANDRDFELETVIKPVPDRFSIVDDPLAMLPAGADRRYLFRVGEIGKEDAKIQYPFNNWEQCNTQLAGDQQATLWHGDMRPEILCYWRRIKSFKSVTDQMRVTETGKDGMPAKATGRTRQVPVYEVLWAKTNGHELLYDRDGNPCRGVFASEYIPFVRCDGWKTWVDKKWHVEGNVRQAISAQEMANYAEAGVAEFVGLASKAPYMGPMKSIAAYKQIWDDANTKPWSFLPYDAVVGEGGVVLKPERVEPPAPPMALLSWRENQNANLRETLGMFQASQGQSVNDESGYARQQVRLENDVNHYHFASNFADALQLEVTILIDLWANLYKGQTALRILGEEGQVQNVTVNQEQPNPEKPRAMWADVDEQGNPRAHYDLRVGRYGVTVKLGPSFATQAEQNTARMDTLMQRMPPQMAGGMVPFYVKAANFPDKDKMFNVAVAMQPQELQPLYRDDPEGGDIPQQARALKAIVAQTIPMLKQQHEQISVLMEKVNDKETEQRLKLMQINLDAETKRLETIGKVTATQMQSEASLIKEGMKSNQAATAFAGAERIDQTADDARTDAKTPNRTGGEGPGTGGAPGAAQPA